VGVGHDGRVLLHCFAGCSAGDVVAAAGLSLADLFVKRDLADLSLTERAAMREHARQARWRAALNVVGFEAKVVVAAAGLMLHNEQLDDDELRRLGEATALIDSAREVLGVQSS
jgi:hypothetical protein